MKIRISLMLLFLLLLSTISHAQDKIAVRDNALFTYTVEGYNALGMYIGRTTWLPDSSAFQLAPIVINEASHVRFQYDIDTNNMRVVEEYTCERTFTTTDIEAGNNCVLWLSPDGRFTIYTSTQTECFENPTLCYPLMALANLTTQQQVIIQQPVYSYSSYRIHWSENNQAFLIEHSGESGVGLLHVRIPDTLEDSPPLIPTLLSGFGFGEITFADFSPDGWQVLIQGGNDPVWMTGMLLWDARWPVTEKGDPSDWVAHRDGRVLFEGEWVDGAKFITGEPNQLLVVLEEGIVLYDLETQGEKLLNPDISSIWTEWVYFSPDEQYALAFEYGPNGVVGSQVSLFHVHARDDTP